MREGATIADVLDGRADWVVVTGDCLANLPEIPEGSIGAVICDPPYGINTKSDGDGKLNPWADLCNAAFWYAEWFRQVRRVLADNGSLWTCLNWRSLPTFQKASCDVRWPIESLMVWDKRWIGPGGPRGLRPSYEMVAILAQPGFAVADRGVPDVQPFPWSSQKPSGHPAEKPEALMGFCVTHGSQRGSIVCDPFTGSGTTGVSAIAAGRRFIGIETDEHWAESARARIRAAEPVLFTQQYKPQQLTLGGQS